MQSDEDTEDGLAAMVEEVFAFGKVQPRASGQPEPVSTTAKTPAPQAYQISAQVLVDSPRPVGPGQPPSPRRELKTASELATMIEADLAQHPDCPKTGFRVTVYGSTRWRAMLTITPAAGRLREPQMWRDLTEDLAERLRQRYDLAW